MEKLDPQRRELLEARMFSKGHHFDNTPFNQNGNASMDDDSGEAPVTPVITSQPVVVEKPVTPSPLKGRKRKTAASTDNDHKHSRAKDGNIMSITGHFPKKDGLTSPNRNTLISSTGLRAAGVQHQTSRENSNDIAVTSRGTQTDPTEDLMPFNNRDGYDNANNAATIQELRNELAQVENQLRTQVAAEKKLKEKNARSVELLKEFLVQQTITAKKKTREETMRNRLRLGQFNTVRQGASFVDGTVE